MTNEQVRPGIGPMSKILRAVEADTCWGEKRPDGTTRRDITTSFECKGKHLEALQRSVDAGLSKISAEGGEAQERAGYPFAEGWRTLYHCHMGFCFLVQIEQVCPNHPQRDLKS
jgi:hypothetical protein